jgi:hypothetical protein
LLFITHILPGFKNFGSDRQGMLSKAKDKESLGGEGKGAFSSALLHLF